MSNLYIYKRVLPDGSREILGFAIADSITEADKQFQTDIGIDPKSHGVVVTINERKENAIQNS